MDEEIGLGGKPDSGLLDDSECLVEVRISFRA